MECENMAEEMGWNAWTAGRRQIRPGRDWSKGGEGAGGMRGKVRVS
jgi:hypothetical protein